MTRIIEVFRLLGSVFIADADNLTYRLKVNSDGSVNTTGSITASLGAYAPKGKATLAVSGVSSRVALPTADTGLVLRNSGATDAYFAIGSVTVAATTSSFLIKAGDVFGLDASGTTYIAGITASSTTTFEIWTGTGLIATSQAGGSGGGGGGAVTIADGAAVTIGAVADAAWTTGSGTLVGVLKGIYTKLGAVVLAAGTALVGKVGIDQTTPGVTNLVDVSNFTTTVDQGSGATSANTIRVRLTTDDLATLGIGGVGDTAWVSGNGSIIAVLKGVFGKVALMVFGAGTAAAAQRTTLASDDPAVATLGATSGAAVITDANGTIQQYLRGLIKQWIAGTLVVGAGSNLIGSVGHGKTIKSVSGTVTSTTDVVTAVTSKRIKVIAYLLETEGVVLTLAKWQSNATTEIARAKVQAPAASSVFGAAQAIPAPSFLFATAAGEKLTLNLSGSDSITYTVTYFDDDTT